MIFATPARTDSPQEAKEDFTLLILTGAVIGFLILLGGTIWIDKIVYALGASDLLFPYCKDYLMVLFLFIPANILQTLFSNLFVTAGDGCCQLAHHFGGAIKTALPNHGPFQFWPCERQRSFAPRKIDQPGNRGDQIAEATETEMMSNRNGFSPSVCGLSLWHRC